jgi:hypothetical protein
MKNTSPRQVMHYRQPDTSRRDTDTGRFSSSFPRNDSHQQKVNSGIDQPLDYDTCVPALFGK